MSLEPFQHWVMQTGVTISLLILLILLIRRPFARAFGANAAYALWSLPLLRLCLPVISVPETWVPKGLRSWAGGQQILDAAEPIAGVEFSPSNIASTFEAPTASELEPALSLWAILILIWLSVAAIWFVFQLAQQCAFKVSLLRDSTPVNETLAKQVEAARTKLSLRRRPEIRLSKEKLGPLVTGVLTPLIILPQGFETDFTAEQRQFALVHELSHIKRGDLWAALAALLFRAVQWPNPLVHFAAHRMRADQEAACDAYVLKRMGQSDAHSYAETLVLAARQNKAGLGTMGQLALSLTETDSGISKGD